MFPKSTLNLQDYNLIALEKVDFLKSPSSCLFSTTFYPEIHEVDVWQVYRARCTCFSYLAGVIFSSILVSSSLVKIIRTRH